MHRKRGSDFPQEFLDLFDGYVHGGVSRRQFLDRAKRFAVGGATATKCRRNLSTQQPPRRALWRDPLIRPRIAHLVHDAGLSDARPGGVPSGADQGPYLIFRFSGLHRSSVFPWATPPALPISFGQPGTRGVPGTGVTPMRRSPSAPSRGTIPVPGRRTVRR
jgi:hypothetical protein